MNQSISKKLYASSAVLLTAAALVPLNGSPLLAQVMNTGSNMTQAVMQRPQMRLHLSADRQIKLPQSQGPAKIQWQPLDAKQAAVLPSDVVRYTLSGVNTGNGAAKNLSLTQPIPPRTVLLPNTIAVANNPANTVTYSVDNGKTFTAQPKLKVNGQEQAAPIAAYTHLRINLKQAIAPKGAVTAQYQVQVK
jgi:uncharacterized repeat protein (TIGR01451 family)